MLLVLKVRILLQRLVAVVAARAEDLHSLVPGEMARRFRHVFCNARQADVAPTPNVHFRAAVDVGLRHCFSESAIYI